MIIGVLVEVFSILVWNVLVDVFLIICEGLVFCGVVKFIFMIGYFCEGVVFCLFLVFCDYFSWLF